MVRNVRKDVTVVTKIKIGVGKSVGRGTIAHQVRIANEAHYENKLTKNIRQTDNLQIYTNFEQIY